MSLFAFGRAGLSFLRLINDPTQTDEIFKISRSLRNMKDQRLRNFTIDRIYRRSKRLETLYAEKYFPNTPDLHALHRLPEGTFGHAYASHMLSNGLDADFYWTVSGESRGDYLINRVRQTHDIWHVAFGYDTSVKGELKLQAAYLAQHGEGFAGILLAAGILHLLKSQTLEFADTMDEIMESYLRAKRACPLVEVRWEERWATPLTHLREELSIR